MEMVALSTQTFGGDKDSCREPVILLLPSHTERVWTIFTSCLKSFRCIFASF